MGTVLEKDSLDGNVSPRDYNSFRAGTKQKMLEKGLSAPLPLSSGCLRKSFIYDMPELGKSLVLPVKIVLKESGPFRAGGYE
jgi:hypothetical protein